MKNDLFKDTSDLKKVKVTIDDIEVPFEDIIDIEVHYSSKQFQVEASIIFKDTLDILSTFKNFKNNKVTIFYTDSQDDTVSRDFYIANLAEVRGETELTKTFIFNLIDCVSWTLKNTFFSKGYNSVKITDVIEDIFSIFKVDLLYNKEFTTRNFNSSSFIYENLVIPQDRSLYDFIDFYLKQEGLIWFQQNTSLELNSIKKFYPSTLKRNEDYDFLEDVPNPKYMFKILDFTADYNNGYENLKMPRRTSLSYNPETKSMDTIKYNLDELYKEFSTSPVDESYIQSTDGSMLATLETGTIPESKIVETYFNYLTNTSIDMFVSGKNKNNSLLDKRGVYFRGAGNHREGQAEGNVILGGEYIVFAIHDKILGNKMIQRINVGRLNNTSKEVTE